MSLKEVALATGVDLSVLQQWAVAPCPPGMDPQLWADAQRVRVERARPWSEQVLSRLPRYMAGAVEQDEAAAEAA